MKSIIIIEPEPRKISYLVGLLSVIECSGWFMAEAGGMVWSTVLYFFHEAGIPWRMNGYGKVYSISTD